MPLQPPAPAANPFAPPAGPPIALQLVDRIFAKAGPPPKAGSVDRIVAGDPATPVTGVAVMAIASLAGLRAAAAAGHNLVVAYDGPFWSDPEAFERIAANPRLAAKRDFIRGHDLVVLRLRDHWRDRVPDGISAGMARTLGWEAAMRPGDPTRFALPPTTLLGLARALGSKLDDRTLRVVGDPRLPVSRVAASWGNAAQLPTIALLNSDVDVVVCGYAREWEAVEYAQDLISTGAHKGLILLGQAKSIEGGMGGLADWLRTIVPEVPVALIPAAEPYWALSNQSPSSRP